MEILVSVDEKANSSFAANAVCADSETGTRQYKRCQRPVKASWWDDVGSRMLVLGAKLLTRVETTATYSKYVLIMRLGGTSHVCRLQP